METEASAVRQVAQEYKATEKGGVNPGVCVCAECVWGVLVCVYMSVCYESMTWWPPRLLAWLRLWLLLKSHLCPLNTLRGAG